MVQDRKRQSSELEPISQSSRSSARSGRRMERQLCAGANRKLPEKPVEGISWRDRGTHCLRGVRLLKLKHPSFP
jgi:hypothetical protein